MTTTRIVCISDTHDLHDRMRIPSADVLIHAGDLTMNGDVDSIVEAYKWLNSLPHRRIITTPGNHDFAFQGVAGLTKVLSDRFPRVETLIDEATSVDSLKIWASPWQPWFHNWAYNFARGEIGREEAHDQWALIPDDTNILVTHGPAHGVLDDTGRSSHVGCAELRSRIRNLKNLQLHVCGHIHEAYGTASQDGVLWVNASSCTWDYEPTNPPIVVDISAEGAVVVARDT